ncbi:hypothetical protein ACVWZK_008298 [Bradyrhizobium sp. GM0.4]
MRRELPPQLSTSHRSRPGDMTLPDVVKLYNLSLNVPVDRFCEVAGIGTTRFYELVKDGVIRVRKNGRHTTAPAKICSSFCAAIKPPPNLPLRRARFRPASAPTRRTYPGGASGGALRSLNLSPARRPSSSRPGVDR